MELKKSYIFDFFNKFHFYTKNQKSRSIIVVSLVDGNCLRLVDESIAVCPAYMSNNDQGLVDK